VRLFVNFICIVCYFMYSNAGDTNAFVVCEIKITYLLFFCVQRCVRWRVGRTRCTLNAMTVTPSKSSAPTTDVVTRPLVQTTWLTMSSVSTAIRLMSLKKGSLYWSPSCIYSTCQNLQELRPFVRSFVRVSTCTVIK